MYLKLSEILIGHKILSKYIIFFPLNFPAEYFFFFSWTLVRLFNCFDLLYVHKKVTIRTLTIFPHITKHALNIHIQYLTCRQEHFMYVHIMLGKAIHKINAGCVKLVFVGYNCDNLNLCCNYLCNYRVK